MALILLLSVPSLTAEASTVGDSLVIGIQSSKTFQLHPLEPVERDMMSVYDLMYDGVMMIDDDYQPVCNLAESWSMSPNGKTWTFRLREDICFSDGEPLNAQDVVATANWILSRPAAAAAIRATMST